MDESRKCSLCGAELPVGSSRLHCLGCLLQLGLVSSEAPTDSNDTDSLTEASGDCIGRYRLLQQIGEGGCGVVYKAEQETPVRRQVALKIIKLGMDTRNVIARFEAERQALAMMDHPNIAKVLDAGATETGRPYFVMELVQGVKITKYCDQKKLSTYQRLSLFVQVCEAIQHAHQKGVIHRDIKPSNILVTEENGRPVPKVIDFGIAKATTDQTLTDKTLYTAFEQFIGTPAYMSPEQAGLRELDIDTRTDIYSLGALLYELLTGQPPFPNDEFRRGALDETLQTIREKEPMLPSSRLAALNHEDLAIMAGQRQSEPLKLPKLLRGELDWIVMKALDKDRNRRYETANGFALDVQRLLDNEPVSARPPSRWYRIQKLVSRNKVVFTVIAVTGLILVAATTISLLLFVGERNARKREAAANQSRIETERVSRKLLFSDDDVQEAMGQSNIYGVAETNLRKRIALRKKMFGTNDLLVQRSLRDLTWTLTEQNRLAEAEQNQRLLLSMDDESPTNHLLRSDKESLLAILYQEGKLAEADRLYRESSNQLGENLSLFAIAPLLWDEGKYDEARAKRIAGINYEKAHQKPSRRGPTLPVPSRTNTTAPLREISGWGMARIIDPEGDCVVKTEPDIIRITIPATPHNLSEPSGWTGYYLNEDENFKNYDVGNNAPRILKSVRGNFTVQVEVTGALSPETNAGNNTPFPKAEESSGDPYNYAFNSAGLMLRETDAHAILFEREDFLRHFETPRWQQPPAPPKFSYLNDWGNQIQQKGYSLRPFFKIMRWLRLVRKGNRFTAFTSHDGVEWMETDAIHAEFPEEIEVGILARGLSRRPFTVEFSNFSLTTNTPVVAQKLEHQ